MKIPMQVKIAELERRIVALETKVKAHHDAAVRKVVERMDLEPEMGTVWDSVDALFKKAFRR